LTEPGYDDLVEGAPPTSGEHTNQVVFVATTAWTIADADRFSFDTARIAPDKPSTKDLGPLYQALLAKGTTTWLHDASADERDAPPNTPTTWVRADESGPTMAAIRTRIKGTWTELRRHRLPRSGAELSSAMRELRHRIYLAEPAARAVFDFDDPLEDFIIILDVRFRYLLDRLQMHLSTSVWNFTPAHPYHLPPGAASIGPQRADVVRTRDTFIRLAGAVERFFGRHLASAELSVHLRRFTLPQFWVAASLPNRADPAEYLELDAQRTRRLARTFLRSRDPRGSVSSRSVIDGCLLVLRRMRRVEEPADDRRHIESDVPTYLILPTAGIDPVDDSIAGIGNELVRSVAETELATANAITALSDLEAETAARLFEVEAELDICRNHMAMYNAAAERAGFLLDALSTHLPIRRGSQLAMAHRQVDLLHQILLQAVADLAHVSALIRARANEITEAARAVQDDFDDKATEFVPWQGVQGVREALTETGLFGSARLSAHDRQEEANRVKDNFDDLLKAIESAFEERRVRETDQIQRASTVFALALGGLSIATIFDGNNGPDFPPFVPTSWIHVTGEWANLAAVLLVLVGAVAFLQVLRVGQLGSRAFRDEYDGRPRDRQQALRGRSPTDPDRPKNWHRHTRIWQLMLETSTDNLDRLVAEAKDRKRTVEWDQLDAEFAGSFATIWDRRRTIGSDDPNQREQVRQAGEPLTRRHFDAATDIEHIGYQIEQWGVQALLFTERARRMYRYRLPVLTCLYRCCGLISDSFLKLGYVSPENMVADVDFYRTMELLGFTATQVRAIDEWLRLDADAEDGLRSFPCAEAALDHVRKLNLSSTMDDGRRTSTMDIVLNRTPTVPQQRPPSEGSLHIPAGL
jgi:hypothetical protein